MRQAPSLDTLDLMLDRDQSYDLKCGICFGLLRSPVQCRHGHLFCASCMAQVEQCPECRVPCSAETVARALFVEKTLSTVKIHCLYHFGRDGGAPDPDGCPAVLVLPEQSAHQTQCKYRWAQCRYCDAVHRQHALEEHETACDKRLVSCEHCAARVCAADLETHLAKCPDCPIECKLCSATVKRRALPAHNSETCPEAEISCPFSGCSAGPIRRRDIEEHYRSDAFLHLNAMERLLREQLVLQNRLLKAKDDRILALETQMLRERKGRMKNTIVWRIPRWSQLLRDRERFVRSQSFLAFPGFKFFFGMFLFGEGSGDNDNNRRSGGFLSNRTLAGNNDDKVSVYLFLEKGSPENAIIEVEFSFALVNHQYEAATVSFYYENVTYPLLTGEGWGEEGIILTHCVTPASGFVQDDSVVINGTFRTINLSYDL